MSNDNFHGNENANRVSAVFFKLYLSRRGIVIEDIGKKVQNAQSEGAVDELVQWKYASKFTIKYIQQVLDESELDYIEFVDSYAEYLKLL